MTVSTKLRATLATLEGVVADFSTKRDETSDAQTKEMFNGLVTQTEHILSKFKSRMEVVKNQEPQYKEEE